MHYIKIEPFINHAQYFELLWPVLQGFLSLNKFSNIEHNLEKLEDMLNVMY